MRVLSSEISQSSASHGSGVVADDREAVVGVPLGDHVRLVRLQRRDVRDVERVRTGQLPVVGERLDAHPRAVVVQPESGHDLEPAELLGVVDVREFVVLDRHLARGLADDDLLCLVDERSPFVRIEDPPLCFQRLVDLGVLVVGPVVRAAGDVG